MELYVILNSIKIIFIIFIINGKMDIEEKKVIIWYIFDFFNVQ